jgi:hypothetical protein
LLFKNEIIKFWKKILKLPAVKTDPASANKFNPKK